MTSSSEELIKELKYAAQQKLVTTFLGTGMVGRAVGQRLERKYREGEPLVAKALSEQNAVQTKINTTIVKLEPLVTKIARTVHLIAKVWSKHVFAKQEELRVRRENLTKERAAAEEEENERKQAEQEAIRKESLSGLQPATDTSGKSGVLGTLLSDSRKTKSFIKSALSKIGTMLLGATVIGAGVVGAMSIANRQERMDEEGEEEGSTNLPESVPEPTPNTTSPYETTDSKETATSATKPSISAADIGLPETPSPTTNQGVSGPYEGPLFFQRTIDATAGEGSTTVQAQVSSSPSPPPTLSPATPTSPSVPIVPASATPAPVALPTVSSTPLVGAPTSTYQTNDTSNPPATSEVSNTRATDAPMATPVPQQNAIPNIQNIVTNFQQTAGNITGPSSMIGAMSDVASSLTGKPSSLASDVVGGLSGVSQSMPSVINDMTGFVARNVESGNQLSSLTALIDSLARSAVQNIAPVVSTQTGTTDMDGVIEGAASILPSPIADRGYLDVDTIFESQY